MRVGRLELRLVPRTPSPDLERALQAVELSPAQQLLESALTFEARYREALRLLELALPAVGMCAGLRAGERGEFYAELRNEIAALVNFRR